MVVPVNGWWAFWLAGLNDPAGGEFDIIENLNNGIAVTSSYHGMGVITKLANLMGCDPDELYLPEAST